MAQPYGWRGLLRCGGLIGARDKERDHHSDTADDGTEREMVRSLLFWGCVSHPSPLTYQCPGCCIRGPQVHPAISQKHPRTATGELREVPGCPNAPRSLRTSHGEGGVAPPGDPGRRRLDAVRRRQPPSRKFTCPEVSGVGGFSGEAVFAGRSAQVVSCPARLSSGGRASLVARLAWRRVLFGKVVVPVLGYEVRQGVFRVTSRYT